MKTSHFLVIALFVGACARFTSLAVYHVEYEKNPFYAFATSSTGFELVEVQRLFFDSDARVVVGNGDDKAPGVAGVDDDFNSVIDDESERGAFRSDDDCRVLSAQESSDSVTVLSLGAFVASASGEPSQSPSRFLLKATIDGKRRCWMVGNLETQTDAIGF